MGNKVFKQLWRPCPNAPVTNILPTHEVVINIIKYWNKFYSFPEVKQIKVFNLSCQINKNAQAKTPDLPPDI